MLMLMLWANGRETIFVGLPLHHGLHTSERSVQSSLGRSFLNQMIFKLIDKKENVRPSRKRWSPLWWRQWDVYISSLTLAITRQIRVWAKLWMPFLWKLSSDQRHTRNTSMNHRWQVCCTFCSIFSIFKTETLWKGRWRIRTKLWMINENPHNFPQHICEEIS